MSLSPSEEIELLELLALDEAEEIWSPLPGPQSEAYDSLADEMFYGGSAGGGKTDLVLGLAITRHKRTLILRRESTQLRGIVDRSRDIIGSNGRFNEVSLKWRDIPGGRTIEMGGCQYDSDKRKYQGRPHDLIAVDEAPEMLESSVQFIIGWARTEDPKQRVRVVLTGNPPTTAEGQWIIRRYAPWLDEHHPNPAVPGELRWFAMIDGEEVGVADGAPFVHDGEEIQPKSRTFIPARVDDNPYYMATGYKAQLQALPEPLRSQMLYGDFSAGVDDDPWQIIPTEWVRLAQRRWAERTIHKTPISAVGVDVARGGKDSTIIAKRYDNWLDRLVKHPGKSTPDGPLVAAQIKIELDGQPQSTPINVDIIGVGTSVYDALTANGFKQARGVNSAGKSTARDKSKRLGFVNLRAEMWWNLREILDPESKMDVALPPDSELFADLCAPKWKLTVRGIQVEDKEEIKKRIGRSPDSGDATALAFAKSKGIPFIPGADTAERQA